MSNTRHPVILFDGVCNLCHASVNFVIDRDPSARFRFAALQDEVAQELLRQHHLPTSDFDSMVLIEDDAVYLRSSAALRIAKRLPFPWFLLAAFLIIPSLIRDPLYSLVAKNRYRWFGKEESCRLPTPGLMDRFLTHSPAADP